MVTLEMAKNFVLKDYPNEVEPTLTDKATVIYKVMKIRELKKQTLNNCDKDELLFELFMYVAEFDADLKTKIKAKWDLAAPGLTELINLIK